MKEKKITLTINLPEPGDSLPHDVFAWGNKHKLTYLHDGTSAIFQDTSNLHLSEFQIKAFLTLLNIPKSVEVKKTIAKV